MGKRDGNTGSTAGAYAPMPHSYAHAQRFRVGD